jgi:hypothetical protein
LDHRFRHDESYLARIEYILMNPVRRGLVENPEEWAYKWVDSSIDLGGGLGEAALPG